MKKDLSKGSKTQKVSLGGLVEQSLLAAMVSRSFSVFHQGNTPAAAASHSGTDVATRASDFNSIKRSS